MNSKYYIYISHSIVSVEFITCKLFKYAMAWFEQCICLCQQLCSWLLIIYPFLSYFCFYLHKVSHYINNLQTETSRSTWFLTFMLNSSCFLWTICSCFQAESIMSKLSDADRIQLQSQLDEVCDKQNHVADTVQEHIQIYYSI